ncbi:hypothetical protein AAG906_012708 [Vitis piasezkii]
MHHFRSTLILLQKQLSSTGDNAPEIGKEKYKFIRNLFFINILKHFKTEYPNLPWGEIIKLANLQDRDEKSCSHRWNNYLRPDINKGEFFPQEDELIIHLKSLGVSWASMVKHPLLERRSPNAIKNRWYNHLKKRSATISDPRRPLPYHAWVSSWITDDDLNPISLIPKHTG